MKNRFQYKREQFMMMKTLFYSRANNLSYNGKLMLFQ